MKKYIITSLLSLGLLASPLMATSIENKNDKSVFIASIIGAVGCLASFVGTLPLTLPIYVERTWPKDDHPASIWIKAGTVANITALVGIAASIYAIYKTYPTNEKSQETNQGNTTHNK